MNPVPVKRTPVTIRDYARAVIRAWRDMYRTLPTKAQVGILWAQYALETGKGPFCWNWNIANVKCTQAQAAAGVPYMMLAGTWEIEKGKKVIYQPPHPATWFRAYESLGEAMTAHLRLLRDGRYRSAWPAIEAGDPEAFAHKLKEGADGKEGTWDDYYTAPVEHYVAAMRAYHKQWMNDRAFDDVIGEAIATMEAPTEPEMEAADDSTRVVKLDDFRKVPSNLEFPERVYDLDDDPNDAA